MTTFLDFAPKVLANRQEDGIRGYKSELNRYALHIEGASFAAMPIADIKARHLREWLRDMSRKDAADTRGVRKITADTIKRSYALVSSIFTAAVEQDVIEMSPCHGVKVKKRADENSTRDKWAFLTVEEQAAIASCEAISLADRLAMRFAIATGLRQGEQFNLELTDLHVGISSPFVKVRYGSRGHLPPKSGRTREVPLFKDGLVAAREWLYVLPTYAPENPLRLVFPSKRGTVRGVGKPLGRGTAFHDALRAAGITRKGPKWHSLRHTAATNLITGAIGGRRWSLDEIRVFLGHSSPTVTLRYAHLGADALKAAARETEGPGIADAPMTERELPAAPDTAPDLSVWFDEEEAVAS